MTTSIIPPFISLSILISMFATLMLAWFVLHRGLLMLDISKPRRIIMSAIIGAVLLAWFFLVLFLARRGFFEVIPSDIPQFPNVNIIILIASLILSGCALLVFSRAFRRLVDALPLHLLMEIQLYRVFGIFFLILYAQALLPAEFAISAGMGDVLVGITAPLVAYLYFLRKCYARKLAIAWNIIGIGDLVLAVTLGVITSPSAFQLLAFDAPNVLVSAYPLAIAPTFGVPLSFLLHVFALRKLWKGDSETLATSGMIGEKPLDRFANQRERLKRAVLESRGALEPALRQRIAENRGIPPELVVYVDKVHRVSYTITDEDAEALRQAGYSDDAIFETTVSAALGAGVERFEFGLKALKAIHH